MKLANGTPAGGNGVHFKKSVAIPTAIGRNSTVRCTIVRFVWLVVLAWLSSFFWYLRSASSSPKPEMILPPPVYGLRNVTIPQPHQEAPRDDFSGGLLAPVFDRISCRSRYESPVRAKPSPHKPSALLLKKLRQYEDRHKRCGPYTESYNITLDFLKHGDTGKQGCRYVIWTPNNGLGNRILSLASAFLYALVTDRVVLVDQDAGFAALMCEPFPDTSWLLPRDFPLTNINSFRGGHPLSYGRLVRDRKIRTEEAQPLPSLIYIDLVKGRSTEDAYFFCEPDQLILKDVPWLLVRSDHYFVPALFLNTAFDFELLLMFPEKEAVFHHLSRYLFRPSNPVWDMISSFYKTHLADAAKIVGIQIRIFHQKHATFNVVLQQLINCTKTQKLIPKARWKTAVIITSLYRGFDKGIRTIYEGNISVHQPSYEGWQKTGNKDHEMKAWAEMYLLSFADELVTSARSTFGYVGQGLGGVKPLILVRPGDVVPEPACVRDISVEPCFHSLPRYFCEEKKGENVAKVVRYVTRCKDEFHGLKLVDNH